MGPIGGHETSSTAHLRCATSRKSEDAKTLRRTPIITKLIVTYTFQGWLTYYQQGTEIRSAISETKDVQIILHKLQSTPCLISNFMHKILIYLHIIHSLKSSTCFEHYPAHLQVYVVIVYMQPLVLSLHIYNYDVELLKMSRVMLETCRGF